MARTRFQKGTEMYELFNDYWQLIQEYWQIENNDQYWSDLVNDSDVISKKYKSSFADKLIQTFLKEQEERFRKENK